MRRRASAIVLAFSVVVLPCVGVRAGSGNAELCDVLSGRLGDWLRDDGATVNVVLLYPLGRFCEGTCWDEGRELAAVVEQMPQDAVRLFVVVLAPRGETNTEAIRQRTAALPKHVRAVVSDDAAMQVAATQAGQVAPLKLVLSRDGDILALDGCGELKPERLAFQALVRKYVRHLYRNPRVIPDMPAAQ